MIEATDLTYPAGAASVPARLYRRPGPAAGGAAVVLCPGRFRDITGLEFLSTALAERGYNVLATQYRGMDMFTDDADLSAGLDWLTAEGGADPARLGAVGHSRGGSATLRAAALDSRFQAVVALAPPTDFTRYMRAMELLSPMRYQGLIASVGGTPDEAPERYQKISALNYADRIKVPVYLVVGSQDLHAPVDQSKWMQDAILKAGNPNCRLEVLDGVGHFFERMYFGYQFERVAELVGAWLSQALPA